MRNASRHQGENERQRKKGEQERIQHFLHKTYPEAFWKFHVVVVQNNSKEIYKNSVLYMQVAFLLIRPIDCFGCFCCRLRLALHDFIFSLS